MKDNIEKSVLDLIDGSQITGTIEEIAKKLKIGERKVKKFLLSYPHIDIDHSKNPVYTIKKNGKAPAYRTDLSRPSIEDTVEKAAHNPEIPRAAEPDDKIYFVLKKLKLEKRDYEDTLKLMRIFISISRRSDYSPEEIGDIAIMDQTLKDCPKDDRRINKSIDKLFEVSEVSDNNRKIIGSAYGFILKGIKNKKSANKDEDSDEPSEQKLTIIGKISKRAESEQNIKLRKAISVLYQRYMKWAVKNNEYVCGVLYNKLPR